MSALTYRDGSYYCSACDEKLRIPPGATVRQSYTTIHDGARERVLLVAGVATHRCADQETAALDGIRAPARRR
jgi:hypothetical protein